MRQEELMQAMVSGMSGAGIIYLTTLTLVGKIDGAEVERGFLLLFVYSI